MAVAGGNTLITRAGLEAHVLPVSATGSFGPHPLPLGIERTLHGRIVAFDVRPVPAWLLYFDEGVARQHGLGPLTAGQFRPINPLFVERVTGHFALQIPDAPNAQPSRQVIDRYYWRSLEEPIPPDAVVRMTASRYAQCEGNLGDGRSGYLFVEDVRGTVYTLFPKGVGITPCCDPVHAQEGHGDGRLPANEGLSEPIFTRVYNNLFTYPTPDTVMVLGLDYFSGTMEDRIPVEQQAQILVRAGLHVRLAHLIVLPVYLTYAATLAAGWAACPTEERHRVPQAMASQTIVSDDCVPEPDPPTPRHFMEACAATGVLRYWTDPKTGEEVPDLHATLVEIVDRFALTAAEQFCWRFMHSVPSAGNAQITGSLLDLASSSTAPRTAAMHTLTFTPPHGEPEFYWRLMGIRMMDDSLRVGLTRAEQARYHLVPIQYEYEFRTCYARHLTRQYLLAAGLKPAVADAVLRKQPALADAFRRVAHELATWENPGPIPTVMDARWVVLPDAEAVVTARSVVDLFGFLGRYAAIYFRARAERSTPGVHLVMQALRPIYADDAALRQRQKAQLRAQADALAHTYAAVMEAALRHGAIYHDDAAAMPSHIMRRAGFRNGPMEDLYVWRLRPEIVHALRQIDPQTRRRVMAARDPFWRFIHRRSERSMRNVEALLHSRGAREGGDGRVAVGIATFGNVTYRMEIDRNAGTRHIVVQIPVQQGDGPLTLSLLGEELPLPSRAAVAEAHIDYGMGPQDGRQWGTVRGTLVETAQGLMLTFAIQTEVGAAGIFEGTLRIRGIPDQPLLEYAYVAPDHYDIEQLLEGPRHTDK